jgi:hypothetical protein
VAWLLGALCTLAPTLAHAGPEDVVLLPTVVPARDTPEGPVRLRPPDERDSRRTLQFAHELDQILGEAVQDLGLTLDVSERPGTSTRDLSEPGLIEHAKTAWVVSPRIVLEDSDVRVRIVAVPPGSKVVLIENQLVDPKDFEVRPMVMLRELVREGQHAPPQTLRGAPLPPEHAEVTYHARSQGRAVLALNAAALGGYVGYSLQRASGSSDPRLTYPLIALGTGLGLGGSMIVADEWDVGLGDAWYLSAGAWWPGAAGFLLATSYGAPEDNRFAYGLLGATAGITLGTVALTFGGMGEGGAALTHSGGAFGLALGALVQLTYEGRTDVTPTRGMGYGAAIGVLGAGLVAREIQTSPSRVLFVDLSASLGGLTGAAAASPLVFGKNKTPGKDRVWLGSVAGGTLIGAGVGVWITNSEGRHRTPRSAHVLALPYAGVIAESVGPDGKRAPVLGGGLQGTW